MTPIALVFMVLAFVVVWGGLVASTIFLARRPEVVEYSEGDPKENSVAPPLN